MQKLYTSEDSLLMNILKNLLEENDIPCLLRNNYLSSAVGGLPPTECWIELWLLDENRLAEAQQLIQNVINADEPKN